MSSTLKVQNFYYTNVTSESIPSSGAFTFNVALAPTYTNGFLVISAENTIQREIVYFHSVSGNVISVRAENRGLGGTTAKEHIQGESITMRDVAEIFNFYSDAVSTCFFTEKTGGLNVKVWGGLVYYNTVLTTVTDTNLTLTDNTINYIKYDYTTNIISADTVNIGNIKAIVTVVSGVIVSIVYNTAKETYTDFTVSLNTALPSQPGNAGKFLQTDGTNATWQSQATTPNASATVKGVVEIATTAQVFAETDVGETGAPLSILPSQLSGLFYFGDGRDGNVTISSNTSLTRDMYYNNLTVNTGINLDPAGFAIYVKGTLTLTGTAKIVRNGNNGTAGSNDGVVGTGGAALATGTCGACVAGVNGTSGSAGTAGLSVSTSYFTATGSVGGAAGGGQAGGAGGTSTRGIHYYPFLKISNLLTFLMSPSRGYLNSIVYGGLPGGGSGAGSGSGDGGGGGSGSNGGIIFIYAKTIAGSGTIEAKGGNGGAGGNDSAGQGGGGGAGGSGGCIFILYSIGTLWTITLTGGTGGALGTGGSGGSNGTAGATGITGQSITLQV